MGCVYKRNWTIHRVNQCYRTVIGYSSTVPTTFSRRVKGLSENCSFPIVRPFSLATHRKVPLRGSVYAEYHSEELCSHLFTLGYVYCSDLLILSKST